MDIIRDAVLFASGTVTATGNSGVIATPNLPTPSRAGHPDVMVPLYFTCLGTDQATDETNDVTIDWYADSGGTYSFGTTTFAQMTAGDMIPPPEAWPGDVTAWNVANGTSPAWVPALPYCKITHTLVGTTKSMAYTVWMSYLIL